MVLHGYSVFDTKALVYSPPFFQSAHGAAIRMFMDLANDVNTTIGRHPADYILFHVCQFDDQTGLSTAIEPRAHLADAISLLNRPKQQSTLFEDTSVEGK
ncbi:nonstructural protein [robinz microvirus RP_62]|nr:nonstructural protein [robinz microvirus RP_62]